MRLDLRRTIASVTYIWAMVCGVMMILENPVYAKVIGILLIFTAVVGIIMVVIKNK